MMRAHTDRELQACSFPKIKQMKVAGSFLSIPTNIHIYTDTYIHINTHTHTHIQTHTYIHIYIHNTFTCN